MVAGGLVFVSGQTASPLDSADGTESSPTKKAEAQTAKALEKVGVLLQEAGSSVSKVVSATIYVRDLERDLPGVDDAWKRWIGTESAPSRTVVKVEGIGTAIEGEELCVEITVTAVS